MKRLLDIVLSLTGLVILSPLFVAVALLVRRDSPGPAFFRQERIGRNFRPFTIYKFRTMTAGGGRGENLITVEGDPRVTGVGRILRKYKVDELPQLFNVLKGDMSLVGPRPEVREYVELFRPEYGKLLSVRPGITDPASLYYSREECLLSRDRDWQEEYVGRILPRKISLSMGYVENHSLLTDFGLIFRTVLRVTGARGCSAERQKESLPR